MRFSSVEDVKCPARLRDDAHLWLVTLDLAAWLPTPCVQWSYYHTLLVVTLAPVVCIVLAAAGHWALGSTAPEADGDAAATFRRDLRSVAWRASDVKSVVTVLIMAHAPICSVLFEFYHFDGMGHGGGFRTSADDRELYLARDYTITFSSEKYQAYRGYATFVASYTWSGCPSFFLCSTRRRSATAISMSASS